MIILCFAVGWSTSVVAQGNPWNNPVVSPRVDTGGEVTFCQCSLGFTSGTFGTVYGRHMSDAERN